MCKSFLSEVFIYMSLTHVQPWFGCFGKVSRVCNVSESKISAPPAHVCPLIVIPSQTLAISSVSSDDGGADCSCWEAWASGLRVNRTLQHISLHSCSVSAASCSILCDGLEANSTLTRLVLDYNSIGDEGCNSLSRVMYAAAMRRIPDRNDATSSVPQVWGLQEVSVVANGIGERGGAGLLRTLVAGGCKLLVDGIGWAIASEVELLQPDDPNFTELRVSCRMS